ncbi:DNA-binding MarR family transcriptional regulator [Hungatella effluvii]|uniref:DNA-binding MarR family transcriptional regulator n=1 Tax=Hungatella effluvii TaxID=1096246 RepID=A0A2V3XYK9_9FIRM|nr:MarR family transcriptional regulator [Hungatella effluvii]PXX46381.1 DNA-binding MarR family transcriptional regulator [Hungatella effluvii]
MQNITHFASYGGVFFRKSQTYMTAAFKEMGLSFLEGIILINVCENPGAIQEQIAYNLALDVAAVARCLKQMESRTLIRREIDVNNQRTKKTYATDLGSVNKETLDTIMQQWNNALFESLTDEEVHNIVNTLLKLREISIKIDTNLVLHRIKELPEN